MSARIEAATKRRSSTAAAAPSRGERGFAIIGALFLVSILALLGIYLARITAHTQTGSAMDLAGVRAGHAARSGLEWGLWQVLKPPQAPGCFAPATIAFADGALQAFSVVVSCTAVVLTEAGTPVIVYRIVARACNQPPCTGGVPAPGYVDRQVETTRLRR